MIKETLFKICEPVWDSFDAVIIENMDQVPLSVRKHIVEKLTHPLLLDVVDRMDAFRLYRQPQKKDFECRGPDYVMYKNTYRKLEYPLGSHKYVNAVDLIGDVNQ